MAAWRLLHHGVPRILTYVVLPACSLSLHSVLPGAPSQEQFTTGTHHEDGAATHDILEPSNLWDAPGVDNFMRALGNQQHRLGESGAEFEYTKTRPPRAMLLNGSQQRVKFLLDTNVGFEVFDDLHYYRALESLFVQYPHAEVEMLRISSDWAAGGYPYGNSLPFNLLQKYDKMGYGPLRTKIINGKSNQEKFLRLTSSTPGFVWWNKYGVELAKEQPGGHDYPTSPEVYDHTARLAVRLILLQSMWSPGDLLVFSDLTVLLRARVSPGAWTVQTNPSERALQGPALWVSGQSGLDPLQCALKAFDAAALRGSRDPDAGRLQACLSVATLDSSPGLGLVAHSAAQGVLDEIKLAVRDNAPDKQFVEGWKRSSRSLLEAANPLFNPYRIDQGERAAGPGRMIMSGTSNHALNVSAQKSCPALVLPGYMKAGSTAFYEMLIKHPMVLSQQRGPHYFSEGSLYWDTELSSRYMWTPMIEHGEPFVWFDVGLFYGEGPNYGNVDEDAVLDVISRDCLRTPKILWLLREPVSMMISAFRYTGGISQYGGFQQFIDFVRKDPQNRERSGYYYSIRRTDMLLEEPLRWQERLQTDAIHAVNIEEWGSDPGPSLLKAFELMGLPDDVNAAAAASIKRKSSMENENEVTICRSGLDWLEDHFAPRKQKLMKALGRELKGWSPPKLPHGVFLDEKC